MKLQNKVLFTQKCQRHTGVDFAANLKQACEHWWILDKYIVALTHENASNITLAATE